MHNLDVLDVKRYEECDKEIWDSFVERSKNGTFLHKIDYLHYHAEKFRDLSLLIKNKDKVVALMPGNVNENTFFSHQGLTYGGLLILPDTKVEDIIQYVRQQE